MKRRLKFTLYHGFIASLALHSAIAAPFVFHSVAPEPEQRPLVIELEGAVSDTQTEQHVLAQSQGNAIQNEANKVKPTEAAVTPHAQPNDEQPTDVAVDDKGTLPPPSEAAPTPTPVEKSSPAREMKAGNGVSNATGEQQQQDAQTIALPPQHQNDRLDDYVKQLARKIQGGLVYPADARHAGLHGVATVSFTILTNGQIRPNSLKIAKSSGEARLDAGALETIRTTAPFAAPPEEISISIALMFGRKR